MKLRIAVNVMIWLDDEIKLIALTRMQITNFWQVWAWKHMHFWNLQVKDYTVIYGCKKKIKNWRKYSLISNYISFFGA